MPLSMYQASVPVFVQMLTSLRAVLDKAEAHATAKKIDPSVLLSSRLFPDMFPLTRQVPLTSEFAKGPSARLAGSCELGGEISRIGWWEDRIQKIRDLAFVQFDHRSLHLRIEGLLAGLEPFSVVVPF